MGENNKAQSPSDAPSPGSNKIYEIWTEGDGTQSPSAALSLNIEIYEVLTEGDGTGSPSAALSTKTGSYNLTTVIICYNIVKKHDLEYPAN